MSLRSLIESNKFLLKLWLKATTSFGKIHWLRTQAVINGGVYYSLTESEHDAIRHILKNDYLVVLTRRKSHLTTYLIAIMSKLTTGKSSHYAHSLMNVEGDIDNNMDYKLIEATAKGVHYSTFMEVFNCDSVALLKPRGVELSEWTLVLEAVKKQYGKHYDNLFDITNDEEVSCVEMIYQGIKLLPNWEVRFANLINLIKNSKELTPQMLYDCSDMDVVFEVRK